MGKVENDIKYCRRIATDKIKKRCENSLRWKQNSIHLGCCFGMNVTEI
jgi:hypothetical protein